ncbi:hypothetical protein ACFQ0B_74515 [Nonomuraea thailandensis]
MPLARSTMALAINQTIMMALSMVVIANLISAPGLGGDIIRGLSRAQVGIMLPAGIAVVIMAVMLDRMMMAVARRDPHARLGRADLAAAGALAVAGLALIPVLPRLWPESLTLNLVAEVNDAVRWAEDNWFTVTTWIKDTTSHLLLNPWSRCSPRRRGGWSRWPCWPSPGGSAACVRRSPRWPACWRSRCSACGSTPCRR